MSSFAMHISRSQSWGDPCNSPQDHDQLYSLAATSTPLQSSGGLNDVPHSAEQELTKGLQQDRAQGDGASFAQLLGWAPIGRARG